MRSTPGSSLDMMSVVFRDSEDPIAIAIGASNTQLRFWINEYLDEKKLRISSDGLLDKYPEARRVSKAGPLPSDKDGKVAK